MTTQEIRFDSLDIDPDIQPRVGGLDADHVRALEENPESWPPLVVVARGSGYVLLDGFHRSAAAQNLGLASVGVRVVPTPPDGDLHALAFALNAAHGRPLTLADRRAFAARLLRAEPEVSNMEVSARTALSPTTVQKIREELEAGDEIPSVGSRIGRDGSRHPVRQPGELPDVGLVDSAKNLISPAERRNQRRISQYLTRLVEALEDQFELKGWGTCEDAAEACLLVLGEEEAAILGSRLGPASYKVLRVAELLGYDERAE